MTTIWICIFLALTPTDRISGSSSQEQPWRVYESIEGRFSILFPGVPTEETYEIDMFFGELTIHNMTQYHGNILYGIQWMDWPMYVVNNMPQLITEYIISTSVDTIPYTYTIIDTSRWGGYPAQTIEYKSRQNNTIYKYTVKTVIANDRQYIWYSAHHDITPAPDIDDYMTSFSLLTKDQIKVLKKLRRKPISEWRYLLALGLVLFILGSVVTGWGALNYSRHILDQPEIWRSYQMTGCITSLLSLTLGVGGIVLIWIAAGAVCGIISILAYLIIWQLWAHILAGIGL